MPIYEYECTSCGEVTEELQTFSITETTIVCSFCQGVSNRKLSLSSFQLSGKGWAKDNYGLKKESVKPEDIRPPKVTTKFDD
jgi:putative FmdB family regulatory protein|tara:strand:+ start:3491 stop:3736 length:246 start_codon:yes stop_codon:yes gene_type:complete